MSDLVIRNARPADYDHLFALIERVLTETGAQKASTFNPDFWRWQCLSPGFETIVVVAEDGTKLVGYYHLVSRELRVFGQPRKVVSLQDLGVLPDYRRHGLFIRMSDFGVAQLPALAWDITYAFPTNNRSFPGFVNRLGYIHIDNMPARLRPLNTGSLLASRLPLAPLWRLLGGVVDALYNAIFPLRPPARGDVVEPVEHFSGEVDEISRAFVDEVGIGCQRDSRFLNWRFLEKPTGEYSAWGLRRGGRLAAYLITRQARLFGMDCLLLMDFGCLPGEDQALLALVADRLIAARRAGAALAVTTGIHPFFSKLWRLGFVAVPNHVNPRPIRFVAQRHTERVDDEVYRRASWFITLADWDVF